MPGTLYLVATPIGNLEDITLRALRVLNEVDLIACEDTRRTRKLLTHYKISKPLVSYHEHNKRERTPELVAKLMAGASVALVSDAGMPLVSDPGYELVREAIKLDIQVVPIPGPSALVTALAASGLPTNEFTFAGFLPARASARRARLAELAPVRSTLILYEAPHRVGQAIEDAREVLGDREAVLARELTKLHEEFVRGTLSDLSNAIRRTRGRGEFVLLIGPARAAKPSGAESALTRRSLIDEIEELMRAKGLDQKTALKEVARARGLSRREVYKSVLEAKTKHQR